MEAPSGGIPTAHYRESDATNLTTPFAKMHAILSLENKGRM